MVTGKIKIAKIVHKNVTLGWRAKSRNANIELVNVKSETTFFSLGFPCCLFQRMKRFTALKNYEA